MLVINTSPPINSRSRWRSCIVLICAICMVIGTVYELRQPAKPKAKAKAASGANAVKDAANNGSNGYVYAINTTSGSNNNNNNNNGNNGQLNGHSNKGFHPDAPLELHQIQAIESQSTGGGQAMQPPPPAVPEPTAKRKEMALFTRMVLSFGLISNARAILTAKKLPDVSWMLF